jgi:hypothetical protein
MERRLARFLTTPIYNIRGNLARAIMNNETTNVMDRDKAWKSDLQNDNENCPKK